MLSLWAAAACFAAFLQSASALSGASPATYTLLGNINVVRARVSGAVDEVPSRISNNQVPRDRAANILDKSAADPPATAEDCEDNKPHPLFNCRHLKKFGKCRSGFMTRGGFCAKTCGRCAEKVTAGPSPVTVEIAVCDDVPPDDRFTCAEQSGFGKCDEKFMLEGSFCARTCGRYPCVEEPQAKATGGAVYHHSAAAQTQTDGGGHEQSRVKVTPIPPPNGARSLECTTPYAGIASSTSLSFFGEVLEETGLAPVLDDPYAALTIFAPTNAAFEQLANSIEKTKRDLLSNGIREALREILTVHIVTSGVYLSSALKGQTHIKAMNAESLSFISDEVDVSVATSFSTPALILHPDVAACNSVVHVIDRVLLPDMSWLV